MDSLDQFKKALPIATFQGVPADLVRKRRVYGNNPARLTQFDCQKTADHVMMRCGGREATHCAGFHQISPRCWWTRNRNGSSSVRRASIGSAWEQSNLLPNSPLRNLPITQSVFSR